MGVLSQKELASWLSVASVFAAPALYEPFGLTVLEAGLSGAALVLGDIPSLKENWEGAALFVDPRDTKALKDTLGLLMRDAGLRSMFAARARERALEYTATRMAEGYLDFYEEALSGTTGFEEAERCVS